MSKIQERIKEIDKSAKRSRLIAIILSVVIIGFIVVTALNLQTISKKNTENEILIKQDSIQKLELIEKNNDLEFLAKEIEVKEQEYKTKLDSIISENNAAGGELWEYAKKTNTVEAYYNYVDAKGINNIDAERLEEIKSSVVNLMTNMAWVQIQESNGNLLFTKSNILGSTGDVRVAKSARSVRNGVIGVDSNSSRNGHVISKGQYVIVEETKTSGNTDWARIRYSNKS